MQACPPLTVRVARKVHETPDICAFELVHARGNALPGFTAGAHIDVQVGCGLVRQYSLCNAPGEAHRYVIAVLRDPASRGGSSAMHTLCEGQLLDISAPRNHFPLAQSADRHLLVAGGIGITPMLAMAQFLAAQAQPFELHYCTRSKDRTAFLAQIRSSAYAQSVVFHHDDGPAGQQLDMRAVIKTAGPGTHLYVCGPTGFMDWVLARARGAGWDESRLHREYFAATQVHASHDAGFELKIASSGRVIPVRPAQSAVAALAEHGIDVPTSCEQGICGSCIVRVLAGTPDHRDLLFTPEEHARCDQFTPCCSRSHSPVLVLDL